MTLLSEHRKMTNISFGSHSAIWRPGWKQTENHAKANGCISGRDEYFTSAIELNKACFDNGVGSDYYSHIVISS